MKKHVLTAIAFLIMFSANAQWVDQNAGFTNDTLGFYEMSLPDKNTAWAVCYDGKRGLFSGRPVLDFTRTTDGGNTWTPGKMGNDLTLRFSNISAIDGQEAWVAMHKIDFSKGGGIFHTIDGGINWEHTNPAELFDSNSSPEFVHFKDKNKGIAVGDPKDGYFEIYTTMNKGKKWKRVSQDRIPAPLTNEVGWISGYAVIGNTVWFGTSTGRMYKSTDFGSSWTVHIVDPIPGTYVNEIAFLDDGLHGVAHLRGRGRTFVFSTSDGGLTWTNYFQPLNWKNSRITAVPGTNAFVSTSVHPNPLFTGSSVSYDAGQTWADIERTAQKAVCRFFDAQTGYAGGFFITGPPFRGGIFKSVISFEGTQSDFAKSIITTDEIVSQKTLPEPVVQVYPTPAKNFINISLQQDFGNKQVVISLLNSNGKLIEQKVSVGSKIIQFNVSNQPSGLYIIKVNVNGQTITRTTTIAK